LGKDNLSQIKKALENPINQIIIHHLQNYGPLMLGSIIKSLSLNPEIGMLHIIELKNLGIIHYVENSPLVEVSKELLDSLNS
jgi:predicted transcriptional regulator